MKITLRLIVSLILVSASVAGFFSFWQVQSEKKRMADDLERRSTVLSESLGESVKIILGSREQNKLDRLVEQFKNRERVLGMIVFDSNGKAVTPPSIMLNGWVSWDSQVKEVLQDKTSKSGFENVGGKQVHYHVQCLLKDGLPTGALVLLEDADYIDVHLTKIWHYNFIRLLFLSALIILTTLLVVRWSVTGPIAQVADWIKKLRMGEILQPPSQFRGDILGPLAVEVSQLAKSLESARAAAEKEAQLRLSGESIWTPEKLKEHVRSNLGDKTLYVISNREPYMHVKQKRKIECIVPASGLVTALEPVLRACGGLWLAHGSGDADRETCDKNGKIRVPPEEPSYVLKRMWLTKEEENGHYYGFSNEGIWPLCHITHIRPVFRLDDWIQYQKVNDKFAQSILEEIKNEDSPLILIQDYHFALLPLLIKKEKPDARIALFWHIPWPNPESFGICPWKQEILLGMLGADIIGFHIQFHCNNFLDTVDNVLESNINWEQFSVQREGHATQVRPFPISVSMMTEEDLTKIDPGKIRETLVKEYGIRAKHIGVGVDRLDYTKGIVERFRGIERFLEKYPEYAGQFTFVELGAPSRTHIQKYHDFISEVEKTVDAINWRFQTKEWKPIVFMKGHHSRSEILPFYRTADLCLVTSLHDGMNLVAKEFISTRNDEGGVLILSQFAGASRELRDALIVNPYDIEAMADCIRLALEMPEAQKLERMKRLRSVVQDKNIYRWAANLISAMTQLPAKPNQNTVSV